MVKSFSHLNKGEIIGDSQSQLAEDYVQFTLIRYFSGLSLGKAPFTISPVYRTQVYLGSDLWVRVSVTE